MSQSANFSVSTGTSISKDNLNQTCFRKKSEQSRATNTDAAGGTGRIRQQPQGGYMGQVGCFGPFLFGKRKSGRTAQKTRTEERKTQAQVIPDELKTSPLGCKHVVFATPTDTGTCSSTAAPMNERSVCTAYRKNSPDQMKSSCSSVNAKAGPRMLFTMSRMRAI